MPVNGGVRKPPARTQNILKLKAALKEIGLGDNAALKHALRANRTKENNANKRALIRGTPKDRFINIVSRKSGTRNNAGQLWNNYHASIGNNNEEWENANGGVGAANRRGGINITFDIPTPTKYNNNAMHNMFMQRLYNIIMKWSEKRNRSRRRAGVRPPSEPWFA